MKRTAIRLSAPALAILAVSIGFVFLLSRSALAQESQIRVFASSGVRSAVEVLLRNFEQSTGHRVDIVFDSSKRLQQRINAGEAFDVAILSSDAIDELIRNGTMRNDSRADFARTVAGIGVRVGAPKPDVSTPEALKQTLLEARTISMNPTGQSARHFYRIVAELEIEKDIKPKLILDPEPGGPQRNVAEGRAELVWTQIPEIKSFHELQVAGPAPADFHAYTDFAIAVFAKTNEIQTAAGLVKFFTSPAAAPILRANDIEPR